MKKKIIATLSALLTLTLLAVGALFVGAATESTEPTLEIKGCNLSFSDSIYIKYAVDTDIDFADADKVELIVTVDGADGKEESIVKGYYKDDEIGYYVFDFKNLAAKNMTDNVYAKVHVKVGDNDYYSNVKKYSVLQYAHKMIESDNTQQSLKDLLKGMLDYGALAQKHFGYKTDRLANASWYYINIVGGTLEDESTSGLYIKGDSVKLTAPEKDADGKSFSHWVNSKSEKVSSPVTVGSANETYTAVYVNYSTGLVFTSNGDGTCYVSGIGSCTDTEIIIPPTYDGDTVVGIGEGAFANSAITEITLPKGVTTIGKDAFSSCESLENVNFDGKESDWNGITIAEGNDAIDTATKYLDGSVLTNSLAYEVNDDGTTCTITGIGGCKSTVLGIPESIDGYTVTAIGEKAFADCTQLTEIIIPNTVKTIGTRAFYGCTGITEMTIPESVTEIGTQIFYKASNLTTVNYYSSYYSDDNPFLASTGSIKKVVFRSVYAAASLVKNCQNIKEVVLAEGITYIHRDAFQNCLGLTSITIPDGVTSIGSYAFSGCKSLTSITIPDSVTSIYYYAFLGCTNLKKVNYTGGVESWLKITFDDQYYAFTPCYYGAELYFDGKLVTEVTVPDTITKINYSAFYGCTSLTSITIPNSVTSIGDRAFYNCTSLTSITIPDSVSWIGEEAFSNCANLKKVNYTGDVDSWLKISFNNYHSNPCYNGAELYFNDILVTEVTVPDTVTEIGNFAFYYCKSLTSITIPDSVTSIGESAFYYCTSLKKVYYTGYVESWLKISFNDWASNPCCYGAELYFNDKLVTKVIVPDTVTEINNYAFYNCTSLASITIPDSVTSIGSYAFYSCTSLTSITIPDGVTSIESQTFYNCTSLTSITIPDSVTSIGEWAFYNCSSLTSVTIPDSVTSIESQTFYNCTSLTSITIPDSVTSIGYEAFRDCTSLKKVYYTGDVESWLKISFDWYGNPCCYGAELYFDGTLVNEVIIPDTITKINRYAFYGCTSLTSITIPDSVTSIGWCAFCRCSSLKKVYYTGTANDWSSISISSDNDYLTDATRYYYSEEKPTTSGRYWHYVDGVVTEW